MKKLFAAVALLCVFAEAAATPENDYLALRDAFRAGEATRVNTYTARLKGHVLEPFALYLQLLMRLKETDPDEIRAFIALYSDSHLSDKLRGDWLRLLGQEPGVGNVPRRIPAR